MNVRQAPSFYLVIVESALETLGHLSNIQSPRKLKQGGRRQGEKVVLDVSIHNHLMQKVMDKNKRGRPDIVQTALLLALGSRLNKEGHLKVFVHTINNEIISFHPTVRLPRNYNRFIGLMEQLFEVRQIPPKSVDTLISIQALTLKEFLKGLQPDLIVLFTENGPLISNKDLIQTFSVKERIVLLIGGFPHGNLSDKSLELADLKCSIYPEPLDTLVVLSYALNIAEQSIQREKI
ncbi:MAG: 16S rRNA methyltransferase [Candidatus Helarchaeota archaeon]